MSVLLLALAVCRPAVLEAGDSAGILPPIVRLNGLTAIPGNHRAFLQVSFSNAAPENISLVEGQTFRGVQLLAVDFSAASIRIENCGQVQTIKICDTPTLATATAENNSGPAAGADGAPSAAVGGDSVASSASGAKPGDNSVPAGAGGAAGKPDGSNSKSANADSGSSNSGNAAAASGHVYYWWLQDAKDIEQTRIATAQSVLAGDMAPQPLTPLTPPLTPAGLIGPDSVYMEHGPGVLISDQGAVIGVEKRTGN